ncbi:DgyrCDS2430 [Dimorphilus gyrociliatus]|uniref:sarcosine oxidasee (formaldehyde-forming) n=1 Tax=Dimorphilus gyrociliatus TaxID=2664684 RepID=A0A7I8VAM7_9ANNE|nr:DgyrCDS2430 [Dimorphilus gyrociliatus]
MEEFDVIVVGAGIMGSSTAYNCIKKGCKTLLLEQFPLPHARGSSTGHSRITRKAYSKELYANMMPEAYKLWSELETETNTQIYKKTGGIIIGKANVRYSEYEKVLKELKTEVLSLTENEIVEMLPNTNYYGFQGICDPEAGVLFADKAVKSFQSAFLRRGGSLKENEKLVNISTGSIVKITTTKGIYNGKSLIVCAGSWTNKILSELDLKLPLNPRYVKVCYWKVKDGLKKSNLPVLIDVNGVNYHGVREGVYGTPPEEYPDFYKVCMHGGKDLSDPDFRDGSDDGEEVKIISNYVSKYMPFLDSRPAIVETCIYTMTPDEDYIIDRHPNCNNIFFGAGFSGHGFKLAPVVGKLLSEMVLKQPTTFNTAPFSLHRFRNSTSKL